MGNLYDMLGVKTSATKAEIRKAFRERAKILHPDKTNGATTNLFHDLANVRVNVPNLVQAVQRHDIDPDMPIGVLVRAITEGPQKVTFQVLEKEKVKRKKAA